MYLSTQVRCFGNGGANMFVLTYSHLCFKVGLPPSDSFREKQNLVCHWSNIMIKGAVCRTKNRPAIQLCYPAVNCSRQVVNSYLPGRLGQVQRKSHVCFQSTLQWGEGGQKTLFFLNGSTILQLIVDLTLLFLNGMN